MSINCRNIKNEFNSKLLKNTKNSLFNNQKAFNKYAFNSKSLRKASCENVITMKFDLGNFKFFDKNRKNNNV